MNLTTYTRINANAPTQYTFLFRPLFCLHAVLMRYFTFLAVITSLLISSLSTYVAYAAPVAPASPTVMVSILPQKYLVNAIAGDLVTVKVLIPANSDPHSFEPSPAQMRAANAASLYLSLGVMFEDQWLPRISQVSPNLAIVPISNAIAFLPMPDVHNHNHNHTDADTHEDMHGHGDAPLQTHTNDPHIWLTPANLIIMAQATEQALAKHYPQHAQQFAANTKVLITQLQTLDATLHTTLAAIPKANRVFLTFHPSWQYFAKAYQFEELSIEVEGREPSPQKMKNIIDAARSHSLTVIFVEPQFSKATANAIAENIKASVISINPLAEDVPQTLNTMANALMRNTPK